MLSLITIGVLITTPALTMLVVSFVVSLFEAENTTTIQKREGNLNA
ncbi:hypothetical protein GCM10025767_33530 [Thalassotalea piscium]|uniref:Uncharacterized protein n=1 Tax=Thalassotalea piscium TaxID=1230533 RepID=A0A7X0NHD7_9GAMM|nr:hypothetical protein [Thalassotalea piscium]